ncbi:MAG: phosphate ABC transporter permease PstA, partial [Gaiellales bacterium]
ASPGAAGTQRRTGGWGRHDGVVLAASAGASFALVWLVMGRIAGVSSPVELAVCWYLAFLGVYWFTVRELDGPVLAGERVMTAVVTSSAVAMVVPLLLILGNVVVKGLPGLGLNTITQTQAEVGPMSAASVGGAKHAIIGTLEQVALAVLMSVPLGFMCAIFLNEVGGPLRRPVRIFVDAMSGVPTIVAGLFIYAVWVSGHSWSGFAAAMAISISMLPIITRTSEEVLRLVPDGLREASLALGGSEWRTVWKVVLPTAASGLVTSVILGVARAIGETAPLIMTAFGAYVVNANPFSGAQAALPLYIYHLITESSAKAVQERAWAASLVLMLMVLSLFALARLIGRRAGRSAPVPSVIPGPREEGA